MAADRDVSPGRSAEGPPSADHVVGSPLERRRVFASLHARMFGTSEPVTVGRFRVLERLGAGATGIVYAAHDPELDRRVALKLMPGSADDERLASAAVDEAKALAKLRHPNVVSVFEIGLHDGDRFIAMDLVRGETLRAWVERGSPRRWGEIVDVFVQAGLGLAAAHAAGVVHRDFKPDNVLVEDGQAKVVDFGFAREPESTLAHTAEPWRASSGVTGSSVVGTPAYMAPEAFLGRSDEASDQFSFCASLYEALLGVRPFAGDTAAQVSDAIEHGRLSPGPRSRRVPSWLRGMLQRGLAADASTRWPSVAELVRNIQRRRRSSRARWLLAGAALGLGTLVAFAIRRDDTRCDGAAAVLQEVWNAERKATIGLAFTRTDLPHAAESWTRAQAVLDRGAARWTQIRTQSCLASLPGEVPATHVDAQRRCLAHWRAELDALADAFEEPDVSTVSRAVLASHGVNDIEACADLRRLERSATRVGAEAPQPFVERLARAQVAVRTGHYAPALPDARALAREADAAPLLSFAAEAHAAVADLHDRLADYEAAELACKEAVDRAERAGDDAMRVEAQLLLISVLAQQGDSARAQEWLTLTASTLERIDAPRMLHAELALAEGNVRQAEGKMGLALAARERGFAIQRDVLDDSDPRLANAHYSLGIALENLGRRSAARDHLQIGLALRIEAFGEHHPIVARAHNGLGLALTGLGARGEARRHFERAIEIGRAALGPTHLFVGRALINLGICVAASEGAESSEPFFRQGATVFEAHYGPEHTEFAVALVNLSRALVHSQREAEGLEILRRVEGIYRKQLRPGHPSFIYLYNNFTTAHTRLGDHEAALASARRALAAAREAYGAQHQLVALTSLELGKVHRARGEHVQALRALDDALATYARVESNPGERFAVYTELASLHDDAGRPGEAAAARANADAEAKAEADRANESG